MEIIEISEKQQQQLGYSHIYKPENYTDKKKVLEILGIKYMARYIYQKKDYRNPSNKIFDIVHLFRENPLTAETETIEEIGLCFLLDDSKIIDWKKPRQFCTEYLKKDYEITEVIY